MDNLDIISTAITHESSSHMFNNKKLEQELAKVTKALEEAQKINAALLESFAQTTTLTDITVRNGSNIFTLQRDGQVFYIETFNTTQDDIELWKKQAGIEK